MAEIQDLSATAAGHARFPENQAPSSLNDGARATEGVILRWFQDTNYSVQATVSGSVIQMTANRTSLTLTGTTSNYMADLLMAFTMGSSANPDGCYVNINGIGKISLRDNAGNSLSSSVIPSGARALIVKDATNDYFRLVAPPRSLVKAALDSPTLTTPALGTPASGDLSNCTGSPTFGNLTVSGNGGPNSPAGKTVINSGYNGSLANNTAATAVTMVAGQSVTIQAFMATDATKNARADAFYDGTTLSISNKTLTGASVDIVSSGANLQYKNTSGASTDFYWSVK